MKLDSGFLRSEYNKKKDKLNLLLEEVRYLLNQEINRKKINIHSFTCRIKPFNSFLAKIRRKNINDPFKQMYDLVGLRIVCLFLPDVKLIGELVQKEFDVFVEDNKIDDTGSDIFGYMALHYKAKLKKPIKELEEIPFEIQVRTISQDAWASISRYLDYKQESFLPVQLRRDFHALSGLFYVADTHFSILKQEQSKYSLKKSEKTEQQEQ